MAKQQKMKHQLEQIKIENDYMLVSKTKQGVLRSPWYLRLSAWDVLQQIYQDSRCLNTAKRLIPNTLDMENHWQTCSWSRHCTLSRHCLLNFGFGLVLCLTSGPKQNVRNTLHPLVHSCHQLVPSVVSTSEFWVIRKFTNCFSLMHTLETNMDAKNWWFSGVSSISCREYCIPHTPHTPNSTTAIFKNPSW